MKICPECNTADERTIIMISCLNFDPDNYMKAKINKNVIVEQQSCKKIYPCSKCDGRTKLTIIRNP